MTFIPVTALGFGLLWPIFEPPGLPAEPLAPAAVDMFAIAQACTCPFVMIEDPPCPVHGPRRCEQCGEEEHDFISCATARRIRNGG